MQEKAVPHSALPASAQQAAQQAAAAEAERIKIENERKKKKAAAAAAAAKAKAEAEAAKKQAEAEAAAAAAQAAYEAQYNQGSQDYNNDYVQYNDTQMYSVMGDEERAKAIKKDEAYAAENRRREKQPDFRRFCWRCSVNGEADTVALQNECVREGHAEACGSGADGCYTEMRKIDGKIAFLDMGCQQKNACKSHQSSLVSGKHPQCNPDTEDQSHCKNCCGGKRECNLTFLAKNKFDPKFTAWKYFS